MMTGEVCMWEILMTAYTLKCNFPPLMIWSDRYFKKVHTFQLNMNIERESCAHNIFNVDDEIRFQDDKFEQSVHYYTIFKCYDFAGFRFLSIDFGWSLCDFTHHKPALESLQNARTQSKFWPWIAIVLISQWMIWHLLQCFWLCSLFFTRRLFNLEFDYDGRDRLQLVHLELVGMVWNDNAFSATLDFEAQRKRLKWLASNAFIQMWPQRAHFPCAKMD